MRKCRWSDHSRNDALVIQKESVWWFKNILSQVSEHIWWCNLLYMTLPWHEWLISRRSLPSVKDFRWTCRIPNSFNSQSDPALNGRHQDHEGFKNRFVKVGMKKKHQKSMMFIGKSMKIQFIGFLLCVVLCPWKNVVQVVTNLEVIRPNDEAIDMRDGRISNGLPCQEEIQRWMVAKSCTSWKWWFIQLFIGFQPSKVMQDFFHLQ